MTKMKAKKVRLYDYRGDVSKFWTISYYVLLNGKPERQRETIPFHLSSEDRYEHFKERKKYLEKVQDINGHIILESPVAQKEKPKEEKKTLLYYLRACAYSKRNTVAKGTYKMHKPLLNHIKEFFKDKEKITKVDTYHFRNYLFNVEAKACNKPKDSPPAKYSPKTVSNYISSFSELFNEGIRLGFFEENPFSGMKKIKFKSQTQEIYPNPYIQKIYHYLVHGDSETTPRERMLNKQLLVYIKFIFYTCNRPAAIHKLQIKDIDFKNRHVTFIIENQKGTKRLLVSISDAFYEELTALKLHEYPSHYYIFSTTGEPSEKGAYYGYFNQRYRDILKNLEIDREKYKLYNFKHTGASMLFIALDYDIERIRKHLGHTDIRTTMSYISKYNEIQGEDKLIKKAPKFGA